MYVPDKLESMFKQFCCVSDNPVPSGPVAGLLVISSTRTARIWPRTALCLTCPESRLSLARRRSKMGARLEMRNPQEVGGGGREPRRSRLLWELEVVIDASFSLCLDITDIIICFLHDLPIFLLLTSINIIKVLHLINCLSVPAVISHQLLQQSCCPGPLCVTAFIF